MNNRTNFQGPNRVYQHGDMMGQQAYMHRGNSVNMAGVPQNMAPPPQLVNQSMMQSHLNQSMAQMSVGGSSVASSSAPQYADVPYAKSYFDEIQTMFVSHDFKNAKKKEKKEIVGNTIYKHVEKLVGEMRAPKITGMLIDLPEAELNYSISQWNHFEQKVMSALQLIT